MLIWYSLLMKNQQPLQQFQQPTVSQAQQTTAPKPKRSKLPLLLTLLAIILIAGVGYGVYSWQHSKVTDLNAQMKSLHSQSTTQASTITDLNNKVSTLSKAATQSKSTTSSTSTTGPFDQTAAITQAVKAYKGNGVSQSTVTVYGVTASGNAAYGVVNLPGGGGGSWLAINSSGSWSVVSQGQVGICKSQGQQYNLPSIWVTESDC
jgi:cytoskeletal protein RodZ